MLILVLISAQFLGVVFRRGVTCGGWSRKRILIVVKNSTPGTVIVFLQHHFKVKLHLGIY